MTRDQEAICALTGEVERLRRELDAREIELSHAALTSQTLERELAEIQDQRSSLLATNYDLRKERDRLTDELAEARGLLAEARQCVKNDMALNAFSSNGTPLTQVLARLAAAESEIARYDAESRIRQERLAAAERERDEAEALLRYVCSLHPDDCECSGCKYAFLTPPPAPGPGE